MLSMLFGVCLVGACGPPTPESAPSPAAASVSYQPSADSGHVFAVTHVHVSGGNSGDPVFLFEGPVSSYYLGKLAQGDIPSTLSARRIAIVSFRAAGELVVAPLQALQPGMYSLVAGTQVLSEFQVASALPLLSRLWPPPDSPGSLHFAVYCAQAGAPLLLSASLPLLFAPRQISANVSPGLDEAGLFSDRCLHFSSDTELEPGELTVPPPAYGDWALAPALFSGAPSETGSVLGCRTEETVFGPGCAQVADDRVVVRTPPEALLWAVHTERGALAQVTASGASLTVSGLDPDRQVKLWGDTWDLTGAKRSFELVVHTQPARERLILNEALADALGPEPQSEWVELLNDGSLGVDLATYSLQDGKGRTALPHALLSAKEYALLVREDFAPNPADEAPPVSARVIRVPALGKSGLSNAGERLSLLDAAGNERSVLPALKGMPGQSLARRTPSAADSDPQSFGFGVPTPGFSNDRGSTLPMP